MSGKQQGELSTEQGVCPKCRWPLQSCDCCGMCGEPSCNCAEELNGDQSEPLGAYLGDDEVAL
jgi:hypothetical protein